jgi:hypothetical protein
LADAVDFSLPKLYLEISAVDTNVPIISSAVISDWLDYYSTSEIEEIEVD